MNIFSNFFKKEAPLLGLQGSGGGLGFLAGGTSGSGNIDATGGTKIDLGSTIYHVFISDQNFVVNSGSGDIQLLVVGGGGAAAGPYSAGGGGGGIAHGPSVPIGPGTYPVVVGTGGVETSSAQGNAQSPGGNSSITLPVGTITGLGGGTGTQDAYQTGPAQYNPGGCGGGNADDPGASGDATQPLQPNFGVGINHYGNPGFSPPSNNAPGNTADGGGGGGAGTGGGPNHTDSKTGGDGASFTGFPASVLAPAIPSPALPGWQPAVGPTGLFGGGGNGARGPGSRPPGGGGAMGGNGVNYTGGGGGGNHNNGPRGSGGDGIVAIKYDVVLGPNTPASGGDINAQPGGDGYVYHLFYQPGSLTVPTNITGAEILVVAPGGGGAQGNGSSGGGGAGGAVHVTGHTLVAGTYTMDVPAGGAGGPESPPNPSNGSTGQNASMTSPAPFSIIALGGGGGHCWGQVGNGNGGSGGGTSQNPGPQFGDGQQPSQPYTVATGAVDRYGNPGGPTGGNPAPGKYRGSGGGGAGGVGGNYDSGNPPTYGGAGGAGQPFPGFAGNNPAFAPMPNDWKNAVGPTGLYAGGGAGGSESGGTSDQALGGPGGGGRSGMGPTSAPIPNMRGAAGITGTGGGGGAGWWYPGRAAEGGAGGRGVILVRYLG